MKKTPQSLRAEAATRRRYAAEALCSAEKLEREAVYLEEQESLRHEANRAMVARWFEYAAQLRRVH